MKKLVVDIRQLTPGQLDAIAAAAERRGYAACLCQSTEQALREAVDAEILFAPDVRLPGVARELKWLCVPSAGVEQYLRPGVYASPDVILTNSSGAYGTTISEHIVMVTLELMRRQPDYSRSALRREWGKPMPMRAIRDCRAVLLGAGDIGRETARRLRAFLPKSIVGVNRSGKDPGGVFDSVATIDALDEILPRTDLLVMSLPGTPETTGIMDGRRLSLLPKDAFLVNVGRGNAIDEAALVKLMRAGRLAGAALDVFRREPLPADDPLWDCPRLLITPHTAGNMTLPYTVQRIVEMFLENFESYCDGRPMKRVVDRALGY